MSDLARLRRLIDDLEDVNITIEDRNKKTLAALKLVYHLHKRLDRPGRKTRGEHERSSSND